MSLGTAIERLLEALPRRVHDVLARRFGLAGKAPETLEAIGKTYGITRERVRQIETYGLALLEKPEAKKLLGPFIQTARLSLEESGGLRHADRVYGDLKKKMGGSDIGAPHVAFLLEASRAFTHQPEDADYYPSWALNDAAAERRGTFIKALILLLKEERRLLAAPELSSCLVRAGRRAFGKINPSGKALGSYLETSKRIAPNPFGFYGLAVWPEVNPRGVRDYAYLVFRAVGKPLHFRAIAEHINRLLKLARPAHEQTVHNELIKDDRFVLVGRGMYGLREWGYEPGTVREVLAAILASSRAPLTRDEIVAKVKAQRFVKDNTVFLNLQNRKYFVHLADGRYACNNRKGIQSQRA